MSGEVRLTWDRCGPPPADGAEFERVEIYDAAHSAQMSPAGNPVDATATGDNRLYHGDNLAAMSALADEFTGKIDLVYIDPPYGTGRRHRSRVRSRSGDTPPEHCGAFDDRWGGGPAGYLDMITPRLEAIHNLLSPTGAIYVHADWRTVHYIKVLMDEIFGRDSFQNEIAWCYREALNSKKRWNRKHDTILFYTKSSEFTFNYENVLEPHAESTLKKYKYEDEKGPYRLMGRGLKNSPIRSARDVSPDWEEKHPELTYRHYLPPGKLPVDYWNIDIVNQAAHERTGYATQKPEALLDRIILASTNPGDIVADFFCGSGTTSVVAAKNGRRWIACDSQERAICTTRRRLLALESVPAFSVYSSGGMYADHMDYNSLFRIDRNNDLLDSVLISLAEDDGNDVSINRVSDGSALVFWAVDAEYSGGAARPGWWSAKRKKKEAPASESPPFTVKTGAAPVVIAGFENGEQIRVTLATHDPVK